eukprot:Hpha_TRINITY_DN15939_c1_g12::TRINITY_DN15939_c1_g12_i1::g.71718::m.71718
MGVSIEQVEIAVRATAGQAAPGAGKGAGSCNSVVCPDCGVHFGSTRWATRHRRYLCRGRPDCDSKALRRSGLLLKRSSSSLGRRASRLLLPSRRVRPASVMPSLLTPQRAGVLSGGDVRLVSALLTRGRARLLPPVPNCRRISLSRHRFGFVRGRQRWPPPRDALWPIVDSTAEEGVPAAMDTSSQEIRRCFIPSI